MNKYNVGDRVHCYRAPNKHWTPFDFHGTITRVADTGDGFEYTVTNAPEIYPNFPCLIWESEIIGLIKDIK